MNLWVYEGRFEADPVSSRHKPTPVYVGERLGEGENQRMGESLILTVTGERVAQKIVRQLPSISAQAKLPGLILLLMAA